MLCQELDIPDEMGEFSPQGRTLRPRHPACRSLELLQSTDQAPATRTMCPHRNGSGFFPESRSNPHSSADRHKRVHPAALCLLIHKCACADGRNKLRPYLLQLEGEQFPCPSERPKRSFREVCACRQTGETRIRRRRHLLGARCLLSRLKQPLVCSYRLPEVDWRQK